jgi:hypothetical protein
MAQFAQVYGRPKEKRQLVSRPVQFGSLTYPEEDETVH